MNEYWPFGHPHILRRRLIFGGANSRNAGRLHILQLNTQRNGFEVSTLPPGLADRVTDTNQELDELTFGSGFGIVTEIQIGPDHAMYVLSYGGSLYRIVPEPRIAAWTVVLIVGWCRRRGAHGSSAWIRRRAPCPLTTTTTPDPRA